MSNRKPFFSQISSRFFKKKKKEKDRYGYWYVVNAYIAAEVELCIGLVTTALILIYQQNFWLAVGTLTGFLILEFLILMAISMAENLIYLRKQIDAVVIAGQQGKPVEFNFEVEDKDEEDPYKVFRIIGISTAVTVGIVLARTYL